MFVFTLCRIEDRTFRLSLKMINIEDGCFLLTRFEPFISNPKLLTKYEQRSLLFLSLSSVIEKPLKVYRIDTLLEPILCQRVSTLQSLEKSSRAVVKDVRPSTINKH